MNRQSLSWILGIAVLAGGCASPESGVGREYNFVSNESSTARFGETQPQVDGARILARVGRDIITDQQLKARILERYYGPRALNGLVRESLFSAEAEQLGIRIEAQQIAERVAQEMTAILGETFESRRRALSQLEAQGLVESDLRREIALEVGPALLIQAVVSHHIQIDEEQILDLWRVTWKEPRRKVDHLAFPSDGADPELCGTIQRWAESTAELLRLGSSLESAVELPVGVKKKFVPRMGSGWIRESELAGNAAFFEVFQVAEGEVLGPIEEADFGWHLFRVVETLPKRPYQDVRAQLLQQLRDEPVTDKNLLAVEALIRNRISVRMESSSVSTGVSLDAIRSKGDR
ncbi:MAG: peptidylprolyl isomerase [Planctomycetota bacterium]|nr:peptidylprolyl isomerase [Planctomycetota bacterium]